MKAIVYSNYDSPDVLNCEAIEEPQCVQSCTGFFVSHNSGPPEPGVDRTAR